MQVSNITTARFNITLAPQSAANNGTETLSVMIVGSQGNEALCALLQDLQTNGGTIHIAGNVVATASKVNDDPLQTPFPSDGCYNGQQQQLQHQMSTNDEDEEIDKEEKEDEEVDDAEEEEDEEDEKEEEEEEDKEDKEEEEEKDENEKSEDVEKDEEMADADPSDDHVIKEVNESLRQSILHIMAPPTTIHEHNLLALPHMDAAQEAPDMEAALRDILSEYQPNQSTFNLQPHKITF
jgi:hypothetical protein